MATTPTKSLDDRLQEIARSDEHLYNCTAYDEGQECCIEEVDVIDRIKQAFHESGYVRVPQAEVVTRWEVGQSSKVIMVNGEAVMAGQGWYDKFLAEYHNKADWIAADESMGDDAEHDVLLAARLAAGIEA